MSRRTHRLLLPVAALALLGALSACGDDEAEPADSASDSTAASTDTASGSSETDQAALDQMKISGDFGSEPKVTFSGEVTVAGLASKTLSEGEGDELASGDQVFGRIWIGNGTSKKEVYSNYDAKPELLTLSDQLLPALNEGLIGQKVGSRVVIAAGPAKAYGEQGNSSLGIGNADTVVFVVDLVSTIPQGPEGGNRKPATWAPAIVEKDGLPTALDFAGAPDPSGSFQRTTLIQGNGPVTKKGDHLYVNYLGQVYGGDQPFDESFSRGAPFDFDLGAGGVVKGWDEGLVGVKVGSRVILQVPPDMGYGEAGQPSVGIKGTDTMYFIVDVLAAN